MKTSRKTPLAALALAVGGLGLGGLPATAAVNPNGAASHDIVAPVGQGGTYPLSLPAPHGPLPYVLTVRGGPDGITGTAILEASGMAKARIEIPPATPLGAWRLRLTVTAANGQTASSTAWLLVDGILVATEGHSPGVHAYSPSGRPVPMPGAFAGLVRPRALAYRAADNSLYVADGGHPSANDGAIRIFSNAGTPAISGGFAGIANPTAMSYANGQFVVRQNDHPGWWILDDAYQPLARSGSQSPTFARFTGDSVGGICATGSQARIYVAWGSGAPSGVRTYDPAGNRVYLPGAFPDTGGTEAHLETPMEAPHGIGWSAPYQRVYVMFSEIYAHGGTTSRLVIHAYRPGGQRIRLAGAFPGLGGTPSSHYLAHTANQLTVSSVTGDVYAITGHDSVNIYSPDGHRVGSFAIPGAASAILAVPYGWLQQPRRAANAPTAVPAASGAPACAEGPCAQHAAPEAATGDVVKTVGHAVSSATDEINKASGFLESISNLSGLAHSLP
ncbi:MAG: hypothetical protein M0037_12080 [Betaproteobacteria bacterium]|nr:hypothetical protein [Betaproteobacteria bacterium]